MKVTANIATYPSRKEELLKMLESIEGQFDEVRVYYNEVKRRPRGIPKWVKVHPGKDQNLTDNGKFYFLQDIKEPEIYCSMDDDILYPPTYAQDMTEAVNKYRCIVTHHGRILLGEGRNYYRGHKVFNCLMNQYQIINIDVCGTGVTAFNTDYFTPYIWHSEYMCMSDLVFSLEAAIQKKNIKILQHKRGYFRDLKPSGSIYEDHRGSATPVQNYLADQIWKIKRPQLAGNKRRDDLINFVKFARGKKQKTEQVIKEYLKRYPV